MQAWPQRSTAAEGLPDQNGASVSGQEVAYTGSNTNSSGIVGGQSLHPQDSANSLSRTSNGEGVVSTSAPGHHRGWADLHSSESLLGQQALDFWFNLCLCHTLIVEDAEDGQPPLYQVTPSSSWPHLLLGLRYTFTVILFIAELAGAPACMAMCSRWLWLISRLVWGMQGPSPDEVALVEGGRMLGFEFVGRTRTSLTVRMQGHEASALLDPCYALLDTRSSRALVQSASCLVRSRSCPDFECFWPLRL